jgi:spore coat polysaccharide biosynthesis predicted glycosyltransferase SpsG
MYAHLSGNTRLFLGLQYALLRREVREAAKLSVIPVAKKVFVAMGGSDYLKLTGPIVLALKDLDIELCVAVGPANSQRQQLEDVVHSVPRARIINQVEYITELASSTLAILAAGSSLWEAAALGVPTIGLIVANNQLGLAKVSQKLGFSVVLDVRSKFSIEEVTGNVQELLAANSALNSMRRSGKQLVNVDGSKLATSEILKTKI